MLTEHYYDSAVFFLNIITICVFIALIYLRNKKACLNTGLKCRTALSTFSEHFLLISENSIVNKNDSNFRYQKKKKTQCCRLPAVK